MNRARWSFLFFHTALLLAVGGGVRWAWFLATPCGPFPKAGIEVSIPPGTSAAAAAGLLEQKRVVSSARLFTLLIRQEGREAAILAGGHTFRGALNPLQVLEQLGRAEVAEVEVTIPEGWTLVETAEALAGAGLGTRDEFLAAFGDPGLIRDLDPWAVDLEGFLFPDTYRFEKEGRPSRVAAAMVANFRRRFAGPRKELIAASNRTLRDIVTLASLVEKETAVAAERTAVAGVFLERLRRGMRLQCDPTVIYALRCEGRWNGTLRREDLDRDHPYNTYTRAGLPPGPIASPGEAALAAALNASPAEWLYFVAKGDGSHEFSRTLAEHNRAVNRYRRLTR